MEEEEDVEPGKEVTSPEKPILNKVNNFIYQFNARGGGSSGRGGFVQSGRGRNVNRRTEHPDPNTSGAKKSNDALMLVDQETLNKKRLARMRAILPHRMIAETSRRRKLMSKKRTS